MLWDREELELGWKRFPLFFKGDKGGFSEHLDGNCSWSFVGTNEFDCDTVSRRAQKFCPSGQSKLDRFPG